MRFIKPLFALALILFVFQAESAGAGPYTDDLSKCIIASTTTQDRAEFVRWMFAAAAMHPAVKSIASVSKEQLDHANKQTAQLFMRLLTESCRQKVKDAIKYEGQTAIQASFQVLGQVAGRELFSSPEVAAGMSGLKKYFDSEKLRALVSGK